MPALRKRRFEPREVCLLLISHFLERARRLFLQLRYLVLESFLRIAVRKCRECRKENRSAREENLRINMNLRNQLRKLATTKKNQRCK